MTINIRVTGSVRVHSYEIIVASYFAWSLSTYLSKGGDDVTTTSGLNALIALGMTCLRLGLSNSGEFSIYRHVN